MSQVSIPTRLMGCSRKALDLSHRLWELAWMMNHQATESELDYQIQAIQHDLNNLTEDLVLLTAPSNAVPSSSVNTEKENDVEQPSERASGSSSVRTGRH